MKVYGRVDGIFLLMMNGCVVNREWYGVGDVKR